MPPNPSTPGPKGGTASITPVSKQKVDKIMRLPGFRFDRKHLFLPHYRDAIHHMLGALTPTGREGRQATVIRRVIIIYRNAIHVHRLYPTYDLESRGFWSTVLSDVCKESPQTSEWLTVPVLGDVVSVYTQGYAEAQDENDDGDSFSGEDIRLDVTKPFKPSTNPKKILLPLVRTWAKIYHDHIVKKQRKTPESTNCRVGAAAAYPPQLPEETAQDYIARLQITIESMAKNITSLEHQQKLADQHNEDRFDQLYATLDRTDHELQEALSDVRLLKVGVGGGEDDPWVPWKDYEAHLDIARDVRGEGPDDELDENGDGDLQL